MKNRRTWKVLIAVLGAIALAYLGVSYAITGMKAECGLFSKVGPSDNLSKLCEFLNNMPGAIPLLTFFPVSMFITFFAALVMIALYGIYAVVRDWKSGRLKIN